ncbi:MAG: exodeoxyribonuclease VII small subunit [Alphaproteobacteria bacterium]|jgi:exodeoxyribonuclease VII small subunit
MAKTELPAEIAKLSFEDALEQLETIVGELETGQAKLDDAINFYERGALLKRHCEAKLKTAQAKIDRIVEAADGALGTEPMDGGPMEAAAEAEADD